MIKPGENEAEKDFVARFMGDATTASKYPDDNQRSAAAYSVWRERGADLENASEEQAWPAKVSFDFIEPGLVHYNDVGTVLVRKSVLDKMANTMIGRPITDAHKDVKPGDYKDGSADGMVSDVAYNAQTGMHSGVGFVWNSKVKRMIRNGHKVSCAYTVKKWGPGGVHNNIAYAAEVLEAEYDHLAIVDDPRYEDVRISLHNSQGGKPMFKVKFWNKQKPEESVEVDSDKATVKLENGSDVAVADMVKRWNDSEKERLEKERIENAKLSDESLVDVGNGVKVSVKDLKSRYLAKNAEDEKADEEKKAKEKKDLENAEDDKMKEAHEKGDHGDKKENCKMCNAAKTEAERLANEKLLNAAQVRKGELAVPAGIQGTDAGLKVGAERYGSSKK